MLDEEAVVEGLDHCVEAGDHLGGKVDKLEVEFSVMLFEMRTPHLKNALLKRFQLVQLVVVGPLSDCLSLDPLCDLEVQHEPLQSVHHLLGRDVGTVNVAVFITVQRVGLVVVPWGMRSS